MDANAIGFLPLYLKMYDDSSPEVRPRIDAFNQKIQTMIKSRGVNLVAAPVCRVADEFVSAVRRFKTQDVCAVITMHLAYSPSLESIDALKSLDVPIIVLDTTESKSFGQTADEDEIMYNHGIHGVQDMCNLLTRNNRNYFLEVGHYEDSDVIDRVVELCKTAAAAWQFRHARAGIVGKPFQGMGDFAVPFPELKKDIGIEVIEFDQTNAAINLAISEEEIRREMEQDRAQFQCGDFTEENHYLSTKACLIVRKWLASQQLTAFTANFLDVSQESAVSCMPFLEAGKAMARGIGYAGEGDVLTASLCGALACREQDLTFTEMFCPDWQGNSIFLSHMGEMNTALTARVPYLCEMDFPYTDASNPIAAFGQYRPGRVVIVNLAPLGGSKYRLILVPGEILDVPDDQNFQKAVHGWFRPDIGLCECLKQYSLCGGTHHGVMVYGDASGWLSDFGKMLGFEVQEIE